MYPGSGSKIKVRPEEAEHKEESKRNDITGASGHGVPPIWTISNCYSLNQTCT
ncbi:hypothetical protein VIBNISFn118_1270008 [Vibrio nigripulchritudo SFn118]|nr:hypothetical protein VIBNISFn118_1270008 [Vibrio nigripulchritudo SFn118]